VDDGRRVAAESARVDLVLLDVDRPFRHADALAAGLTAGQLRGPRFRTVLRGVYVAASAPRHPVQRVEAALLIHPPTAFASHVSAARVYGVPLPSGLVAEHVSVLHAADRRRREGVVTHVAAATTPVVTLRGLRVSSPEQLVVELADHLNLVDLVVVGDALVRRGVTTPGRVTAYAVGTRAAQAAELVRAQVDSPMETRLRLLIVLAGLPEPTVNHVVRWEDGRTRYRFDLAYPDLRVVVEYDGRQHRADLDQWDRDVERAEWLDDDGWRIVTVHSRGIYRRPDQTLARVRKALASRGCQGLPKRFSETWRGYFPVIAER
jgi:hypothetical protein